MEITMRNSTVRDLHLACQALVEVVAAVREDTKAVMATDDPIEVVKHFDQLRKINADNKVSREALGEMEEILSRNQIPELFDKRSLKTINIEAVGRVTVSYKWSASIIDKDRGYEWLRTNGYESLITETVNASTLSAFAKELVQDGSELPDDIFKVGQNPYTSITKT